MLQPKGLCCLVEAMLSARQEPQGEGSGRHDDPRLDLTSNSEQSHLSEDAAAG
jgi:hypothetical protein